jgi:hypothetical protein
MASFASVLQRRGVLVGWFVIVTAAAVTTSVSSATSLSTLKESV